VATADNLDLAINNVPAITLKPHYVVVFRPFAALYHLHNNQAAIPLPGQIFQSPISHYILAVWFTA
jgi:hypothetical protein